MTVQESLFDHAERRRLAHGAWIDVRAGWFEGGEQLFNELMGVVPWRAERRQMYDRVLDVPRLVSFHDLVHDEAPPAALKQIRRRLNDIYAGELGEPFTTAGLCLYRDGNDSVAWHGDTIGRSSTLGLKRAGACSACSTRAPAATVSSPMVNVSPSRRIAVRVPSRRNTAG